MVASHVRALFGGSSSLVHPPIVDDETRELLASFKLREAGRAKVMQAWLDNPEGLVRCAYEAQLYASRNGGTGAGLLVTMIDRDEHLTSLDPNARRVTGWRFVRGTHSGNYVRDPRGTDPLPAGYGVAA